ncbi:KpsF/GutQ family sugar-phosphate isomerase [bacterium]|nr:KpsF/GutQ family sugar-phosphate isomerase [bacterium]
MSIERGRQVIRIEGEAILALEERIDDNFQKAVDILFNCKGRVVVVGLGKSGLIAQKIAATMTSTGTAALFLHAAEGLHGDVGAVLHDDAVICISKSGNTEEILQLIPMFKRQGVPIIAMTGNTHSEMAVRSDVVLDISVKEEACPFDFVPTSSTTATLVMGDALALALFQEHGFSMEEFAQYHPGGSIGRKLLLRVDDIMRSGDDVARVQLDTPMPAAILQISSKRTGATCVMSPDNKLAGVITDGDLRRFMETHNNLWDLQAADIMCDTPKCISTGMLAAKALHIMEQYSINQLIVLDDLKYPIGMVHVHDILKAGVA